MALRRGFWKDFDHVRMLARDMVAGCYHPDRIVEEQDRVDRIFREIQKTIQEKQ